MAKSDRAKSKYAKKQGRARKYAGEGMDGPRTRFAPTSPFSDVYRHNPFHRLALYAQRGEQLERERLDRFRPWAKLTRRFMVQVALP
jgi:hypothetical protein